MSFINYMQKGIKTYLLVFIFCVAFISVNAQTKNPLKIKHTKDFTITGDGAEQEWNNAGWNTIIQRSNEELQKASWYITSEELAKKQTQYQTQFKILYSDKGIYCLYKCEDSAITCTLKEDFAALFREDVVEAFFWPDTSRVIYFEYELSPLNYELPLVIFNDKGNTSGWLPFYYKGERKTIHAVDNTNKTHDGRFTWTAEFFIPYALITSLKNVPPQKGTQWRANFYRIDYDDDIAYSSWQLTHRDFHDYERFGVIEFE
jgi:hypothetical protein